MNRDFSLLNRVLDLVDLNPAKWEQGDWFGGGPKTPEDKERFDKGQYELCGTTGCIAGWALMLSGEYKPILNNHDEVEDLFQVSTQQSIDALIDERNLLPEDIYIEEGARLLNLTQEEAQTVFIDMDYDSSNPHAFTDAIRHLVGQPTRWYKLKGHPYEPLLEKNDISLEDKILEK